MAANRTEEPITVFLQKERYGMKKFILVFWAIAIMFSTTAFCGEPFDTMYPPFGADIRDLNTQGYFVKYRSSGDVDYYNYIGPCKPHRIYETTAPLIVFAFAKGRLYARIIREWGRTKEVLLSSLLQGLQREPDQAYAEDGWSVYVWDFPERDFRYKLKYNDATGEAKSIRYHLPLHKELDARENGKSLLEAW